MAAARFRLAEGRWPQSTEELVRKWIDILPLDPLTGKVLQFSADAKGVRIYGAGIDGIDEGGVETPEMNQWIEYYNGKPDVVFRVETAPRPSLGAAEGVTN